MVKINVCMNIGDMIKSNPHILKMNDNILETA